MTKTNLGTVVTVQIIDGFTDMCGQYNRYHKQIITEILGYDSNGMPIKSTYIEGMYKVTLKDENGELRTIQFYGRKPELESKLRYPKNEAKKDDPWKEYGAYLQSLQKGSLADRIRYAEILENSIL